MKNNYKLHILDCNLRSMDVVSSDTLKELAKLYYDYCQNHQGDLYPLYLMLYKGNEILTCKPEYFQWRKLYNKVFDIERKKKNINKDFEC